ncbi:hypothetical protein [Paenibacillus sp. IHBB 10380]|uniref:hypothetical protein n=1 Tax=Paenibacillus sp. IHBB 10380 TaxID=1566358 RepID=UPI0005CFC26B|nr:hypothetical protein [Paenibacillus sp. IHBB 10380]AJS59326.1 hypothetical protein UB51_13565 [Paenibacillus sp. IHBB 10380]
MNAQLIMVEGMPGSGKSTGARLIADILKEHGKNVVLVLEDDLDHPADYKGVSSFTPEEWETLCHKHEEHQTLLCTRAFYEEGNYFLPYRKIQQDDPEQLPPLLLDDLCKQDIYEISIERHMQLISAKWNKFAEAVVSQNKVYVFECCFIQNPVTVSMIKHNRRSEESLHYVQQLEKAIAPLNPLLIYMDQQDYDVTFNKAVAEWPAEWSSGFMNYYTSQGYGQAHGYSGIEGTLKVLYARKQLEEKIMTELTLTSTTIDNSPCDREQLRQALVNILIEE